MDKRLFQLSLYFTILSSLFLISQSIMINDALAQQQFNKQDLLNTTSQSEDKLDRIIELLDAAGRGSIVSLYVTIIVFMMGLAFVIFGLYLGQEQKLSTFTKRLYLLTFFSLIIPVTYILGRYIIDNIFSGEIDDPVFAVALVLMIPVVASYILMIVKSKHREDTKPNI